MTTKLYNQLTGEERFEWANIQSFLRYFTNQETLLTGDEKPKKVAWITKEKRNCEQQETDFITRMKQKYGIK